MKMLNKTWFCRGPQDPKPSIFLSDLIAVYHGPFFLSLTILQLFSIFVTVLPCKSIWINFLSKMLYGSEYIIFLSHQEKILCNHPVFLLIISIKGSRGRKTAQDFSVFEAFWGFSFSLPCPPSLPLLPFPPHLPFPTPPSSLSPFSAFIKAEVMSQTAQPGISVLWSLVVSIFVSSYLVTLYHQITWFLYFYLRKDSYRFLSLAISLN